MSANISIKDILFHYYRFYYVLFNLNKDYYAWVSAGCAAVSARQPPGRTTIFFPIWGALLLLFLNVGDFLVIF